MHDPLATTLHRWYVRRIGGPKRTAMLEADREWVAISAAGKRADAASVSPGGSSEGQPAPTNVVRMSPAAIRSYKAMGDGGPTIDPTSDVDSLEATMARIIRLSEIENALPLPPLERAWKVYDLRYRILLGLCEARADRRRDFARIPRRWVPKEVWVAFTAIVARPWALLALRREEFRDEGGEVAWTVWQKILAFSDDPPGRCVAFAAREDREGCGEWCGLPPHGKVVCLAPFQRDARGVPVSGRRPQG